MSRLRLIFLAIVVLQIWQARAVFAQTVLTADGRTDAYTLINNAFGGTAEETPDCSHPSFGPHITQSFDAALNRWVFDFNIHVTPDNDRCINVAVGVKMNLYITTIYGRKVVHNDKLCFIFPILVGRARGLNPCEFESATTNYASGR